MQLWRVLCAALAVAATTHTTSSSFQPLYDTELLDTEMARFRLLVQNLATKQDGRHGASDDHSGGRPRWLADASSSTPPPPPQLRLGRPWDPEHPAGGDNETVLVLAHFKERTEWLYTRQPFDYFIVSKCCAQLGWTPHTLPVNRGTPVVTITHGQLRKPLCLCGLRALVIELAAGC